MEKDRKGHRYIERISEIVSIAGSELYEVRDVVRFDGKKYVVAKGFSSRIAKDMSKHLSDKEVELLYAKYCVQT